VTEDSVLDQIDRASLKAAFVIVDLGAQREDQSNRSWAVQGGWRIKETRSG
jgi:hypothetical protein